MGKTSAGERGGAKRAKKKVGRWERAKTSIYPPTKKNKVR